MSNQYPKKIMVKMNWTLVAFVSVFTFLFSILDKLDVKGAISTTLFGTSLLLLVTYANIGLRNHFFDKTKHNILFFGLSYMNGILAYFILWPIFTYLSNYPWSYEDWKLALIFVCGGIAVNTVILFTQHRAIIEIKSNEAELENYRLRIANAEASNLVLKQQIQPHFLFNALNSAKALYRIDVEQGEEYLIKLASFLRSTVSANNATFSTLKEEILLCLNYLEMQRIRFGNALNWTFAHDDPNYENGYVLSFSIQPLLENAIKHNEITEFCPLDIKIEILKGRVIVSNNTNIQKNVEKSTGTGLLNLNERYKLCSDKGITITNRDGKFSVSFKILKNGNNHN